ncbi:hypothetical protein DN051_31725 [Streptomyces cadmiisoli]|uniref:Uncharacterized protein n=1 Tax=Streptomyces cadmiisoli TaxID=2184053 RepID=A0A2Z4J630_9ACTN|nr:hypothetical protein DN051_31725 [Streptomyces cadmiisoli]
MCVNKRREPTTDTQLTRRAFRKPSFRTGGPAWGVVRPLREIASPIAATAASPDHMGMAGPLAGIFRSAGIFEAPRSSFSTGNGWRNRTQEPHPAPARRKSAQAGQPLGSRVFGPERSGCWRWGVTR